MWSGWRAYDSCRDSKSLDLSFNYEWSSDRVCRLRRKYLVEVSYSRLHWSSMVVWRLGVGHRYVVDAEWPQALRFVITFVVPGAMAAPFAFAGRALSILVGVVVLLFTLAVIGSILWSLA